MTLREKSREQYSTRGRIPTHEELKTGCLQRIADACELMAARHAELVREKESIEIDRNRWKTTAERLLRQNAALRGVITRMKREPKSCSDSR